MLNVSVLRERKHHLQDKKKDKWLRLYTNNMDHQYSQYCTFNEDSFDTIDEEYPSQNPDKTETGYAFTSDISIPEKMGDEYLIQLYRERRFLYDKSHRDFKDNELKNNAWAELSSIMIKDKKFGNYYTAEYCKKRMISLREQYIKLKKEQDLKSGSGCPTARKSILLSQLSFLDVYIQRRRLQFYVYIFITITNIKQQENARLSTVSCNKNVSECQETKFAETINVNKRSAQEVLSSQDNTKENLTQNVLCEKKLSKMAKRVTAKGNDENDTFRDLTNAALTIATELQGQSESTEKVGSKSAQHAFAEFIALCKQWKSQNAILDKIK